MSIRMLSFLLLFGLSLQAPAQQAEDIGDYLVHYNTMNTLLLTPAVARAYGIQRAGNRALLNIAVLKKNDDQMNTPVAARVQASASNLAGQRRDLELQEIRDQGAIYYIATFRFANEENLNFRISVQPEGESRSREFTFRQKLYSHQ